MRLVIKQIIKVLSVTEDIARKIEFQMECTDFNFSQATSQEFLQEAKYALIEVNQ
tara:strand:+ start:350 stop:514 length:165 start_codon:yes stop_codon:yes gene_type:complete